MMLTLLQIFDDRGLPFSYLPRTDDLIALILLLCFFFTAFILAKRKKSLLLQVQSLCSKRERSSIFAANTNFEIGTLLLLLFQTVILGGLVVFNFFNDTSPALMVDFPPSLLLGIYIFACLVFLLFKWLLYSLLGWVFFDKIKTKLALQSYLTLVYSLGFMLFPLVLLLVYFDLDLFYLVVFGVTLLLVVKLLMFYKWLNLFFDTLGGLLLFILFFCALEIIPYLLSFMGLIVLNYLLIIIILYFSN